MNDISDTIDRFTMIVYSDIMYISIALIGLRNNNIE